ncbi:M50 family metallopeptidase [Halobium salinum]|uniref:M50 family metallopeptidase n=1 Tax=Halobium salinum TaxID=1364940 RepID=A0ABD5PGN2_9EURY|nr:metalloprotease [Halobium salinum]
MSSRTESGLRFSSRELLDLGVAWVALGLAFAVFFARGGQGFVRALVGGGAVTLVVVSLLTAGVGFLLHELAHKVVATRFGQVAEFRADYGMLFVGVMSALVGFIVAAPGAVHHRGYLSEREHGLIALAGPAMNLLLAVLFVPLLVVGAVGAGSNLVLELGARGLAVNLFLAAFNMIPYGGIDGKTVLGWSKVVWALVFFPSAAVTVFVVFVLGIGF